MNLHVPQGPEARAEAELLMAVAQNIVSPQSNKPVMGIVQDALLASFLMTAPGAFVDRATTCDLVMAVGCMPPEPAILKPELAWAAADILGLVFPEDFQYADDHVVINRQSIRGRLCKKNLGPVENGASCTKSPQKV